MSDIDALKCHRDQQFFVEWEEFIAPERVSASEENIRRLVDGLSALGPQPRETEVRGLVDECVRRFNEIDDGWICTIEREDIYEQICQVVALCGFDCEEDWLYEREW